MGRHAMIYDLPKAISESTLTIGDLKLRCAVLDNGQRVFVAEDLEALFERLMGDYELTPEDFEAIARFAMGVG
jgi:hypothetical protein